MISQVIFTRTKSALDFVHFDFIFFNNSKNVSSNKSFKAYIAYVHFSHVYTQIQILFSMSNYQCFIFKVSVIFLLI